MGDVEEEERKERKRGGRGEGEGRRKGGTVHFKNYRHGRRCITPRHFRKVKSRV
jgi:hypothetical protein